MAGRENDIVWALEQASRYAKKYSEAVDETARLEEQIKALKETLDQAKKVSLTRDANTWLLKR